MSLYGIGYYVLRACIFATIVTFVYGLIKMNTIKENPKAMIKKLLFVFYISMLFEITIIRDWNEILTPKTYSLSTIQLIPLKTTLEEYHKTLWRFIYHVGGNIMWFIPFGMLIPLIDYRNKFLRVLKYAVLTSLFIEIGQFLLNSGISDIDDFLLNVCGAIIGYFIYKLLKYIKDSHKERQI